MNLTLLVPSEPTESFAAVFTNNACCGAPVDIGRRVARASAAAAEAGTPRPALGAVVINNRISNVRPPGGGVGDALAVCEAAAAALGLPSTSKSGGEVSVLPSSTGVIGWRLPVAEMVNAVSDPACFDWTTTSALPAAESIMTTDTFPKVRTATAALPGGGRLVGIAKGAGMVEPNMATMLVFLMTDLKACPPLSSKCVSL